MRRIIAGICLTCLSIGVVAQTTSSTKKFKIELYNTIYPGTYLDTGFNAHIRSTEMPAPDGDSYKSFLLRQKALQKERFEAGGWSRIEIEPIVSGAEQPTVNSSWALRRLQADGNWNVISRGVPNDNSMAISNSGIMVAGINSDFYSWDVYEDTAVFPRGTIPMKVFLGDNNQTTWYFDPKIIYDPLNDRFIMVYLRNNTPGRNRIFISFSSSNDPNDAWYTYELPGNPLDNNRWTDYPAISMTENELFITGNLIIPGESWQIGFDGSIIWQVKKEDGYSGASSLTSTLHHDIRYDGRYIRNLHTVRSADGIAPVQYFLSNRNFDLENDTIFLLALDTEQDDPDNTLDIKAVVSDTKYGVPPNGRQRTSDLDDPSYGMQTNDGRVLGAFLWEEKIQFVSATMDMRTGFCAIYHGKLADPMTNPSINATIIGDSILDLGYPNIAWAGDKPGDERAIIGFDYCGIDSFPGVGAMQYGNDGSYSLPLMIKDGESYIDKQAGQAERWGDYFGIQNIYNKPGHVLVNGYYANDEHENSSWFAYLTVAGEDNFEPTAGPQIFPNPTNDDITVRFYNPVDQVVHVYLTDMNGRIIPVTDQLINQGGNELFFEAVPLAVGVYTLFITDENRNVLVTEKIIKY
jgi:hypothetical protein